MSDSRSAASPRWQGHGDLIRSQLQETRRVRLAFITLADLWTTVDDLGIDPATVEFHDGYAMVVRTPLARVAVFDKSGCTNGPDEHGNYPCDPQVLFGGQEAECQTCGRVAAWPKEAS